jgi:CBS domain-containing protein
LYAARLMSKQGVTHLLAVEPGTGRPVGVISASGLVAVLAAPQA